MNAPMIRHLVAKDLRFHRVALGAAAIGGLLALGLLLGSSEEMFYVGTVLLITVVISVGIYLAIVSVMQERTDGTMPFVMSLPISMRDYTAAKLVATLILFLLPWSTLAIGSVAVILSRDAVPDGLVPYAIVLLVHLLTGYALTLATALVTGSAGWTIGVAGATNLLFQGFMYWTSHLPDASAVIGGAAVVWPHSYRWLIGADLLAVVLILWIAWLVQIRRTELT